MHVLFAILVLAFAGLLWATIATVQHVRRSLRRKRLSVQRTPPPVPPPPRPNATPIAPPPTAHLIQSKQLQISL